MKTLKDLLSVIQVVSASGRLASIDEEVHGLKSDSRLVEKGTVFVALAGNDQDGHAFARDACARGCLAVVVEKKVEMPAGVVVIEVKDSHYAYGMMAAEFYGHPGDRMNMIGLTGTNGKTTTSWIIENMLRASGKKTGVIGTVNYRFPGPDGRKIIREAPLTTPEPVVLQSLLREMADSGVTDVVMEVSSHALAQQRLAGLLFDIGIFTNLSRDHLDYHKTMEDYFVAKRNLFLKYLKDDGVAVVVEDPEQQGKFESFGGWGKRLLQDLGNIGFLPYGGKKKKMTFISCGFHRDCMVRTVEPAQSVQGFSCEIVMDRLKVNLQSRMIGRHNVLNMLTAAGVGYAIGMGSREIEHGLSGVESVPGRLERIALPFTHPEGPFVFVDYAHTPDALENVLLTLRQVTSGRLICIFGCGGNRDRGKRPLMGSIAGRLSDRILVTSDNPRKENPVQILEEIEHGLRQTKVTKTNAEQLMENDSLEKKYAVLEDRCQAIHTVCSRAEKNDVILIAGKGHETYQITAAGKRFFDDRLEAQNGRVRWTTPHLQAATSGDVLQPGRLSLAGNITTDSRTLQAGDVFLALKGEHFDGHAFVGEAVRKGAAALIVSEPINPVDQQVTVIKVPDTLQALGDLAAYRRRAFASNAIVTGITGSSGKTTVKEMTAAIFEEHFKGCGDQPVLKTLGNFNNLVGLPLSLLRINAGHKAAVMEMGMNRPGEIARLAEITDPDIGCITNIQAAHLEGLGNIQGVVMAKGELFATMSVKKIRIVNFDDRHVRSLGGKNGDNVIGFAVTSNGRRYRPAVKATRIVNQGTEGMRFTLHINKWRKRFTVPAMGEHNVANCAAAAAIGFAAGIDPELIVSGLQRYRSGDKRLQTVELPGGIHVLNDAYNANPSSMAAALKTVAGLNGPKKVAVLGDMLELGNTAPELHGNVGKLAAALGFDYLAVTGNYAGDVVKGALTNGMQQENILVGDSTGEIADWLAGLIDRKEITAGDWLLIKGSRGMRMERVLDLLNKKLDKNS